jgi:PTS system nitrogen regulatory IIA component
MLQFRESQGSTGFGGGIAIPHSRGPILLHLPQPLVAVCHLRNPVDFEAHDGVPVMVLFVQITPTVRVHLHLLSRIAKALSDQSFVASVRAKAPLSELLEHVRRMESDSLGKPAPSRSTATSI